MADKPKMPEEPIEFEVPIRVRLLMDSEKYSSMKLHMTVDGAKIKSGEEVLGEVLNVIPVGIDVHVGKSLSFHIGPMQLWKAVERAAEEYAKVR